MALVILDGWGHSKEKSGNPLFTAQLPTFNFLMERFPSTLLQASGQAVGLPWGESGNSEVGHLSIGAGRIVLQYSTRIDNAIKSKALEKNSIFEEISEHSAGNSRVHLAGILTSGKVHASFDHLTALIEILSARGIKNIFLHLFTDGKDSGLKEAAKLLDKLNQFIKKNNSAVISTVIGRNFAMDRGHNWSLTQKAYNLLVRKEGEAVEDFIDAINGQYASGLFDSNLPAFVNKNVSDGDIRNGDTVLFFNFREDSMRQIVQAFALEEFSFFPRELPSNLLIVTMTHYIDSENIKVLFPIPDIKFGLSEVLSNEQKNHLHIAESEKYAHVTYFFNGLNTRSHERETDFFIESLKDIEKNPEMKSKEIADKVIEEIERDFYDFILVNFANADMLAHTGNFNAAVAGLEAVDQSLSRLYASILGRGGIMVVTADHGNVESLTYRGSGEKESRHDINPIPFILVGTQFDEKKGSPGEVSGILADIAPTVLELMDIQKPEEMTGQSLINILSE